MMFDKNAIILKDFDLLIKVWSIQGDKDALYPPAVKDLKTFLKNKLQDKDREILNTINNYSSASIRATNEYEKGISAGIEMFRKYLLGRI